MNKLYQPEESEKQEMYGRMCEASDIHFNRTKLPELLK